MKFLVVFICSLALCARVGLALDVSARSAILYEPRTQTVLFEKNADEQREIASTTKIMTAVTVIENCNLTDVVTIGKSCVNIEGTSMYLAEGERISVSDLLYGMMLSSGNDAALALAEHTSDGEISAFIDMMNENAKRIGMENTTFKNPHGLPEDGHISTAKDMAKLAAYAMQNDIFREVVGTKIKSLGTRTVSNHNKLLRLYEGATGIKTGYTKAAGRCLVSSAKQGEMELIAVTLSAPDDWNDHMRLFNFGFGEYSVFTEGPEDGMNITIPVVGGESPDVGINVAEETALLKKKKREVIREVYAPRFLYAPINKGDCIGKIVYVTDFGEKTVPIVCTSSVEYLAEQDFFQRLSGVLGRILKNVIREE